MDYKTDERLHPLCIDCTTEGKERRLNDKEMWGWTNNREGLPPRCYHHYVANRKKRFMDKGIEI